MPKPERFVFVCINQRPPDHPRPSCYALGAADVFQELRDEQGRRRNTDVKVVAALCLEACMVGPVVGTFPGGAGRATFYGGVTLEDVPAIWDALDGEAPAAYLEIGDAEFELRPPRAPGFGEG